MPIISLQQAKEMIQNFNANKEIILNNEYNPDIIPYSETFNAEEIYQILNQDGCVSVRVYYGMSTDLNIHVILVGVDTNGNDILATTEPIILEEGTRCPPYCNVNAGLNN